MKTFAAKSAAVPLFRPEVGEAEQAQWLGSIRVARPLSFTVLTGAAVVVAAMLFAFACWGTVSRKSTVRGLLLPVGGLITIKTPQAGVITEVLVREGDLVKTGQPLLRIRSQRVTSAGDLGVLNDQALRSRRISIESERRLTEQNLLQRREGLQQRKQSLQTEERQALSELETHLLRLQLAKKTIERHQQLASDGFVAAAQVQSRHEELLDIELRVRNAERNLQALKRDRKSVHADLQALETQSKANLEQLDRTRAALDQEAVEADARNGITATATKDGRVSGITLEVGQSVQPGQTLLSLVPTAAADSASRDTFELHAQLFAPSRTSAFVRTGQKVWLRYAGYPFQKFGMASGEVVDVSRSPIAAADLPAGQASYAEPSEALYRITVRLSSQTVTAYGEAIPLTTGMRLDADIVQEQRRVWEWLFEPVLSIARSGIN